MPVIPAVVYLLCLATSLLCVVLLTRSYMRSGARLLFWCALSFCGVAGNNLLLFIDLVMVPAVDLSILRHSCTLMAIAVLLYGLVWEME